MPCLRHARAQWRTLWQRSVRSLQKGRGSCRSSRFLRLILQSDLWIAKAPAFIGAVRLLWMRVKPQGPNLKNATSFDQVVRGLRQRRRPEILDRGPSQGEKTA